MQWRGGRERKREEHLLFRQSTTATDVWSSKGEWFASSFWKPGCSYGHKSRLLFWAHTASWSSAFIITTHALSSYQACTQVLTQAREKHSKSTSSFWHLLDGFMLHFELNSLPTKNRSSCRFARSHNTVKLTNQVCQVHQKKPRHLF